ncbi:MAG TPA: DNA polymerase III subunit delta' [Stellaceae bacterium]|jgi:DNA polymerase-3 subunit delta'
MPRGVEKTVETAVGPAPRANPDLVGHEAAEKTLRRLAEAGRLPHALLLCGPRGIGKATLAFRLARFVLAPPEARSAPEGGLAIDPESGVFRRAAAGGHADLLTVEREWDPRQRRLRGEIVVEDAREIGRFLHLTAAEGGWRIVVVDGAEEMNRNAANALLKIVEEPPARALLLLVSHNPGLLLPTIRSRCRRFALDPLPAEVTARLLAQHRPDLGAAERETLTGLCGGSIGRVLELADAGGAALHRSLTEIVGSAPQLDANRLHELADRLARRDAEAAYRAAADLLLLLLAGMAKTAAGGDGSGENAVRRVASRADGARWAALRAEIADSFAQTDALNLDKKQALLGAFFAIAELSR